MKLRKGTSFDILLNINRRYAVLIKLEKHHCVEFRERINNT
jgi:hypothetical protein